MRIMAMRTKAAAMPVWRSKSRAKRRFGHTQGVRWHDDFAEFSSVDAKFSIERVMDRRLGSPFRQSYSSIEWIAADSPAIIRMRYRHRSQAVFALRVGVGGGLVNRWPDEGPAVLGDAVDGVEQLPHGGDNATLGSFPLARRRS